LFLLDILLVLVGEVKYEKPAVLFGHEWRVRPVVKGRDGLFSGVVVGLVKALPGIRLRREVVVQVGVGAFFFIGRDCE